MSMMTMNRYYNELIKIFSFKERFEYLRMDGRPYDPTFGSHRYLNQTLYRSPEWRSVRRKVIIRDNGCDMAHEDYPITGAVYIHHLNPITIEDIQERNPCLFDLNNLVCVSFKTHNAIHFGSKENLPEIFITRSLGDTKLW